MTRAELEAYALEKGMEQTEIDSYVEDSDLIAAILAL